MTRPLVSILERDGRHFAVFRIPLRGALLPVAVEVPEFHEHPTPTVQGEFCRGFRGGSKSVGVFAGETVLCECPETGELHEFSDFRRTAKFPHGRPGKGRWSQPGTLCGYPVEGTPYPPKPHTHVAPLPIDSPEVAGSVGAIEPVQGTDPVARLEAVWQLKLRPWLRDVSRALAKDPWIWLGIGSRIFVPSIGWVPLIAYGLFRGYEAL